MEHGKVRWIFRKNERKSKSMKEPMIVWLIRYKKPDGEFSMESHRGTWPDTLAYAQSVAQKSGWEVMAIV